MLIILLKEGICLIKVFCHLKIKYFLQRERRSENLWGRENNFFIKFYGFYSFYKILCFCLKRAKF